MRRKTYLHGVQNSPELQRILALPIKGDNSDAYDEIRSLVTRPSGHGIDHSDPTQPWYCEQCQVGRLFDHQCQALIEVMDVGGLFAQLPVGSGKTLVIALTPTVLDTSALILTYKKLYDQMCRMLAAYRVHFHIRPDIRVETYERLSSKRRRHMLKEIKPGCILADEAHAVSGDSARTGRFQDYFEDAPETMFGAYTGSPGRNSIEDFAANLNLALGEGSPLPRDYPTLQQWGEAINASDNPREMGKLKVFCQDGPLGPAVESVQEGWGRRFLATRGVVSTQVNDPGVKLTIHRYNPPRIKEINEAVAGIENLWERPDGEVLVYAMDIARAINQVRLGGYYRWDWKAIGRDEPDTEWLAARKAYMHDVREYMKRRRIDLDTPGLIKDAHESANLGFASWDAWDRVRGRPKPPTEWIWISKARINWICELARKAHPCIVWTDITEVGLTLARELGVRYYGGGEASRVAIIQLPGTDTIVASIRAHGEGRNLQRYNRAIVAGGGGNGEMWEQLLGRMHRTGQKKDVRYDVLFSYTLDQAMIDAEWSWTTSRQPKKLLSATYVEERPA